ncbi:LacI family DNA-binding transcriptional regulator [Diplocloster agilis]|uniref:LacI family transcriptional regulator n=1 Tax=Diplocloster agilis TaxID=2850323 RepID=A0A949NB19_9FIRM|nr:LacI family DNA-binding transcriptional regulator [Diplocloster agilis]MBU9737102.1 LacI family transcriptional regulator [Diplocloster agilis]MBU9746539.1 LacI family transcriptional regulator [Diplocloster agilis]
MSEKITIVEIAKLANVSTATVSRIINNTGKVNNDKRKKVLDLIEQYDYKPNLIAKALQSSKSNTVGFIVPHINSPYYAQLFFETELIAQKQGYTLMLCNSESDKRLESNILNAFISANVRAIVFMGGRLDDVESKKKYLSEIEEVNKKIPVISCVDVPNLGCIQIYQEQQKSSNKLLKHLSEMGYRDVAMLGGYSNVRTTIKRREEILDNAEKYGISIRREIIESDYSVEGGNIAMQEMLKCDKLPQAIICINDLVATGVLSEAYKNNMSIPKDIAIVGYDNLDISQFIYPGITTIACNYKEYSKAIVDAIQNVDAMDYNTKIAVQTDLIVRGTTQLEK